MIQKSQTVATSIAKFISALYSSGNTSLLIVVYCLHVVFLTCIVLLLSPPLEEMLLGRKIMKFVPRMQLIATAKKKNCWRLEKVACAKEKHSHSTINYALEIKQLEHSSIVSFETKKYIKQHLKHCLIKHYVTRIIIHSDRFCLHSAFCCVKVRHQSRLHVTSSLFLHIFGVK